MAKTILVEIPRSALQQLKTDISFSSHLYNAILETENTGESTEVEIKDARKRARVFIES